MASLDDVLKHLRKPPVPERPLSPEEPEVRAVSVGEWFDVNRASKSSLDVDIARGFRAEPETRTHRLLFGKYKDQTLEGMATTAAGRGYMRWIVDTLGDKRPELVKVCLSLLPKSPVPARRWR